MLVDLTPADIALTNNHIGAEHSFIFAESYERIDKGLFYTNWMFEDLGAGFILTDSPFEDITRRYWADLNSYEKENGTGSTHTSPEFGRRRIDYHTAKAVQDKYFPAEVGVCDYPQQVVEKFPELDLDPRRFLITFFEVVKDVLNTGKGGGWRWEKHGTYIGDKHPQHEYLDDEGDEFESVHCYQIIQLHDNPESRERPESPFIDPD